MRRPSINPTQRGSRPPPAAPAPPAPPLQSDDADVPALVIAYCFSEPGRVGEVALFPRLHEQTVLGRGDGGGSGEVRAVFHRQRPGELIATPPLEDETLSRRQVVITARAFGFEVENVGRSELLVNGEPAARHLVPTGGTIQIAGSLVLYCTSRPPSVPRGRVDLGGRFGEPDRFGIVGESLAAWDLREELARAAVAGGHVLLRGPKGTEKELAARAIHAIGGREKGPFIALIPGRPEPPALAGRPAGGTLFLEEVAERPSDVLSHMNRSDVRIVATMSRPLRSLDRDLAARFASHVLVPPLEARPEDVPLHVRQLVLRFAERAAGLGERFVTKGPEGRLEANVDSMLVDALLRSDYPRQLEELTQILTTATSASRHTTLEAYPELIAVSSRHIPVAAAVGLEEEAPPEGVEGDEREKREESRLRALIGGKHGAIAVAASTLGVSRFQVYRLMCKYGV